MSDNGIVSCLDAKTGKENWRQRLPGSYSASPVFADGRIYLLNESGETTVIAPGKDFRKLASNIIEGEYLASMGVSSGPSICAAARIYISFRSGELHCHL